MFSKNVLKLTVSQKKAPTLMLRNVTTVNQTLEIELQEVE